MRQAQAARQHGRSWVLGGPEPVLGGVVNGGREAGRCAQCRLLWGCYAGLPGRSGAAPCGRLCRAGERVSALGGMLLSSLLLQASGHAHAQALGIRSIFSGLVPRPESLTPDLTCAAPSGWGPAATGGAAGRAVGRDALRPAAEAARARHTHVPPRGVASAAARGWWCALVPYLGTWIRPPVDHCLQETIFPIPEQGALLPLFASTHVEHRLPLECVSRRVEVLTSAEGAAALGHDVEKGALTLHPRQDACGLGLAAAPRFIVRYMYDHKNGSLSPYQQQ
jgi:hypothetical protein